MGLLGRLVKNPNRVRPFLQRLDPVGTAPAPQHIIDIRTESEKAAMPKVSKTGIYRDKAGSQFYFQEGAPITDAQKDELEYVGERKRPNEERALPAAPQNKAITEVETPEDGAGAVETKENDAPKDGAGSEEFADDAGEGE